MCEGKEPPPLTTLAKRLQLAETDNADVLHCVQMNPPTEPKIITAPFFLIRHSKESESRNQNRLGGQGNRTKEARDRSAAGGDGGGEGAIEHERSPSPSKTPKEKGKGGGAVRARSEPSMVLRGE